jgi:hypothetical protein
MFKTNEAGQIYAKVRWGAGYTEMGRAYIKSITVNDAVHFEENPDVPQRKQGYPAETVHLIPIEGGVKRLDIALNKKLVEKKKDKLLQTDKGIAKVKTRKTGSKQLVLPIETSPMTSRRDHTCSNYSNV